VDDNSFFTLVEAVILAILAIVVFGSFKNFFNCFYSFLFSGYYAFWNDLWEKHYLRSL